MCCGGGGFGCGLGFSPCEHELPWGEGLAGARIAVEPPLLQNIVIVVASGSLLERGSYSWRDALRDVDGFLVQGGVGLPKGGEKGGVGVGAAGVAGVGLGGFSGLFRGWPPPVLRISSMGW